MDVGEVPDPDGPLSSAIMNSTSTRDDCRKLNLWGYEVSTHSDVCIQYINTYYSQVLSYGSNQKIIKMAVEADRGSVLALTLCAAHAYIHQLPTSAPLLAAARNHQGTATLYEKMILNAVSLLVEGQQNAALQAYAEIVLYFPKDLVVLKRIQVLCFYMGRPSEFLRCALQVLPENEEASYMHGMLAFALLEMDRIDESEVAARKALAIYKNDYWAQHALCHVLQFKSLFQEAALFMESNSNKWDRCCSFMYSHNWWHLALVYMEWGCEHALDRVFEIYDSHIWPPRRHDVGASVQFSLNALGLLLRLELRGFGGHVRGRVSDVIKHLSDKDPLCWHKEYLLDLLAVWALAYVDELKKSTTLLTQMRARVYDLSHDEQQSLQTMLKVAECLHAYGKGNVNDAFRILAPSFKTRELKVIGASNEQLDVFEEVWCIIALRSGNHSKVSDILELRKSEMSRCPFLWTLMEEYYCSTGRLEEAKLAVTHARSLKESFLQTTSETR